AFHNSRNHPLLLLCELYALWVNPLTFSSPALLCALCVLSGERSFPLPAPEARQNLAQPVRAGDLGGRNNERRRCGTSSLLCELCASALSFLFVLTFNFQLLTLQPPLAPPSEKLSSRR